jgi:hypothetical protein
MQDSKTMFFLLKSPLVLSLFWRNNQKKTLCLNSDILVKTEQTTSIFDVSLELGLNLVLL